MGEIQATIFGLNGQTFGISVLEVFQVIRYSELKKEPDIPEFFEGTINYRDYKLPIISLNKRFGLGKDDVNKNTKVIIIVLSEQMIGLLVNDIIETRIFAEGEALPVPATLNKEAAEILTAVGKKDEELMFIIDVENILTKEEMGKISVC